MIAAAPISPGCLDPDLPWGASWLPRPAGAEVSAEWQRRVQHFMGRLLVARDPEAGGGRAGAPVLAAGPDPDADLLKAVFDEYPHGTRQFAVLMNRHWSRAWSVCQSILLNDHDADEAVQDAFLKVHRYLLSFRFESRFSTWLSRIARREALTRLASRKRTKNLMTEILGDPSLLTAWQPRPIRERGEQFSMEVLSLLDQLDPEDRLVLVMHELEGFEYSDIAEVLETAPGAVRMRALRARKKLRGLVKKA